MKRLKFKKEFNGVGNALKLIPESYRVNGKEFEMTDGKESYRIKWDRNKANVTNLTDGKLVNETFDRIKELMNFNSKDTLGLLDADKRVVENDVLKKSLIKEGCEVKESHLKGNRAEQEEYIMTVDDSFTKEKLAKLNDEAVYGLYLKLEKEHSKI